MDVEDAIEFLEGDMDATIYFAIAAVLTRDAVVREVIKYLISDEMLSGYIDYLAEQQAPFGSESEQIAWERSVRKEASRNLQGAVKRIEGEIVERLKDAKSDITRGL